LLWTSRCSRTPAHAAHVCGIVPLVRLLLAFQTE